MEDMIKGMFKKSVLVLAHPDDEVLWYSSILDKVDELVICFLNSNSNPHLNIGRQRSLKEHVFKNIICLGISESETFYNADFQNPIITKYGIKISKNGISDKQYKENYYKLRQLLKDKLMGLCNVFTHNPWGEYGHAEHVQIYRVVKKLQREEKFNLWFSNYCSNYSFNLMLRYISRFDSEYVTLKIDKMTAKSVKEVYKKNNCWTWFDDWTWFNEESFMKDVDHIEGVKSYGHIFPLNMIKFDPPVKVQEKNRSNDKKDSLLNFIKNKLVKI